MKTLCRACRARAACLVIMPPAPPAAPRASRFPPPPPSLPLPLPLPCAPCAPCVMSLTENQGYSCWRISNQLWRHVAARSRTKRRPCTPAAEGRPRRPRDLDRFSDRLRVRHSAGLADEQAQRNLREHQEDRDLARARGPPDVAGAPTGRIVQALRRAGGPPPSTGRPDVCSCRGGPRTARDRDGYG